MIGGGDFISSFRFPIAILIVATHSFYQTPEYNRPLIEYPLNIFVFLEYIKLFITKVLGNCPVPLFFFISGFLFFYKTEDFNLMVWKDKLKRRIRTLLIPYLCWISLYIFYIIGQKICGVFINGNPVSGIWDFIQSGGVHFYFDFVTFPGIPDVFGYDHFQSAPILGPLWFMRDLMLMALIAPIIWILNKNLRIWPLICCMFYITQIWPGCISSTLLCAWCFFSLGAWFSINNVDFLLFLHRFKIWILSVSAILSLLLTYHGSNIGDSLGKCIFPITILLLCMSIIIIFSIIFTNRETFRYKMKNLSSTTMFIYASHYFIVQIVYSCYNRLFVVLYDKLNLSYIDLLPCMITIFTCVVLCVLGYRIIEKMPALCSVLCGNRSVK